jgi:hypothetical protein
VIKLCAIFVFFSAVIIDLDNKLKTGELKPGHIGDFLRKNMSNFNKK